MAWTLFDTLIPSFDGSLIDKKHVKGGLFVKKTLAEMYAIPLLSRTLDGSQSTLCFVSSKGAVYELINNPSTATTSASDWQKLDFGVSDVLIARGNWNANNTSPEIFDTDAVGNGNDFYVVEGAASPTNVQISGLFGGDLVTVKDGDWIISNGTEWFVSGSPLNWDSISNTPTVINDYVNGVIIAHSHEISDITGLQAALNLKYDSNSVGSHTTAFTSLPDNKLIDVFLVKANFYQKSETYSKIEVYNKSETYSKEEIELAISAGVEAGSEGLIGEVASIAARDALVGGDDINGKLLSTGDRIIAPENGLRKVYEFTGDIGDTGSAFWTLIYVYTDVLKYTQPSINDIAGLKAIVTTSIPVGAVIVFREPVSGGARLYELTSGTDTESSPETIRPNDYAATTNEKVWKLGSIGQTSLRTEHFTYASGAADFTVVNEISDVILVTLNGTALTNITDYSWTGSVVSLNDTLTAGDEVSVTYIYDITLGLTADYYTNVQVDQIINANIPPFKHDATTDPTVNNDIGDTANASDGVGFRVGSKWLNTTTGEWWICNDASSGAAQWSVYAYANGTGAITHSADGTLTIDFAFKKHITLTLNANVTTLTFSNLPLYQEVLLRIEQDGTGRDIQTITDLNLPDGRTKPDFYTTANTNTLWVIKKMGANNILITGYANVQ